MIKKVLVIEDSKIINNVLKKELTKQKLKVEQAFTFHEAQKAIKNTKFHLIILDLHLPDGEGSELIANIQSLTKTKVVVLTSFEYDDLREELFHYGILDYIIKDKNLLYSINEILKIIDSLTVHNKDRILVIDDSKFICKQIRTVLEPRNYTINTSHTAKDALNKLQKYDYKLIILDMELPDMHGLKLLETIRKESIYLDIPIVVLSGTATPEIVRDVLKYGANDYIKKPFVFEEFILKIDLWIDYFKKEKQLKETTQKLEFLNTNLEKLVQKEVQKSREKDRFLLLQSRHAQMGEMISMIAHQWRQPLNAISTAVGVIDFKMKRDNLDKETATRIIKDIKRYVTYLSTTIDDFKDFFKPKKEKNLTNLEIICNKAIFLLKHSFKKKNIEVNLEIKEIKEIYSYENEIVQVIINILRNAEDILIEKKITHPKINIEISQESVTICDNAGGVPKKLQEKIFDPYFSTKEKKHGTGLGLYIAKIIIEDHCHGEIQLTNTKEGACFNISLSKSHEEEI